MLTYTQKKKLQKIVAMQPGFNKKGKVGAFFDLWLICEVLAKKHIMYHKKLQNPPTTWRYTELTAALDSFMISFDKEKVKPAFEGGNKGKRGRKTARQLRNGYIHTLSSNDRKEIELRFDYLERLLTYWKEKLSCTI